MMRILKKQSLLRLMLCAALIFFCLLAGAQMQAHAATVADGYFGQNDSCYWSLDDAGNLIIKPANNAIGYLPAQNTATWPWDSVKTKIKTAVFDPRYKIYKGVNGTTKYNYNRMFADCSNLESVDLSGLDTTNFASMNQLFRNCYVLKDITWGDTFKTNTITSFQYMFGNCKALTSLDLSGFNTSSLTSTSNMFDGCSALSSIVFGGNFTCSNVTDMSYMFAACSALNQLDLSMFRPSKAIYMGNMFRFCSGLTSLNLSGFNPSSAKNMTYMFYCCSKLKTIDLSSFNTKKAEDMQHMFDGCSGLENLILGPNFDTCSVSGTVENSGLYYMFGSCTNLTSLDLSNWDTSKVKSMSNMFYNCTRLTDLNISNWNVGNLKYLNAMFYNCSSLTFLDLSGWRLNEGRSCNMNSMFRNCSKLTTLDLRNWNNNLNQTSSYYTYMFQNVPLSCIAVGNDTTNSKWEYSSLDKTKSWVKYATLNNEIVAGAPLIKPIYLVNYNSSPYLTEPTGVPGWYKITNTTAPNEDEMKVEYISEVAEQTNQWVKEDDKWSYTFLVTGADLDYSIWEERVEDYGSTGYVPGNITVDPVSQSAEITNIKGGFGALTITKDTTDGSGGSFSFVVTLTDENDNPLSGSPIYGGVVYPNGSTTVSVAAGSSVTLTEIPVGYHYSVTENTPDGWTCSPEGASGIIQADSVGQATASFINTPPPPPPPPPNPGRFILTKEVVGRYEEAGRYQFLIALSGLAANSIYTYSIPAGNEQATDAQGTPAALAQATFQTESDGTAFVEVTLGAEEQAVFDYLPIGTAYTITEFGGSSWSASYQITSNGNISKDRDSAAVNTDLSTAVETAEEDETAYIVFTNEKILTQDLTLKKLVAGAETDREFSFTIVFRNLEPAATYRSSIGILSADGDGYCERTFTLKADETVVFEALPIGASYQITEAACPYAASYTVEDANNQGKIASASGQNTDAEKTLPTGVETVDEGEDVTVTFTNTEVARTHVTIQKKWEDDNNLNKLRELSITVQLYAGVDEEGKDKPLGEPVMLTSANLDTDTDPDKNTWTYTWNDLLAYESDGKTPIKYTVKEEAVFGYDGAEPVISGDAENGYVVTITNKLHEYELKLAKVDQDDNAIGVAGAVFRLYPSNYLKADGTVDTNVEDLGKFTSEADENGAPKAISLGKRSAGTYYLVETKAPSKYVKLTSPIKLTILKNGTATMEIQGNSTAATMTTETEETTGTTSVSFTFTVPNPQGSNLPGVGGSGTQIFYISGFGIVLLAGAMMLLTKKKRGTERVRGNQS